MHFIPLKQVSSGIWFWGLYLLFYVCTVEWHGTGIELQQTKVKLVVDVLKPQLTGESDISTVAAIQELEGLVTLDIAAPWRDDAQQPPQQAAPAPAAAAAQVQN